ncbi:MAG: autotransporter outer membrane beta-barrel domain-containing protein [Verrucomicrobiales bacterium]|jgi:outer membrane autotransporter protein|nr:autotransporter outer membrane beta-barrel domain-containing protein [Verrucomicrobiales bacterium]
MNPKLTLLILCALSASALNVLAQNLIVTSDTTVSGTHYENSSSQAALWNDGTWTVTGSDVTLTGTAATGNGRMGAYLSGGGTLNLSSGTVSANLYGIYLTNTSAGVLDNLVITTTGSGGHALLITNAATARVGQINIHTTGSVAYGLYATGSNSTLTVGDNAQISTNGDNARGILIQSRVVATFGDGLRVETTGTTSDSTGIQVINGKATVGANAVIQTQGGFGIQISGTNGTELSFGDGLQVTTAHRQAANVNPGGQLYLGSNAVLTSASNAALMVYSGLATGTNTKLHSLNLNAGLGRSGALSILGGGGAEVYLTNPTIIHEQGDAIAFGSVDGGVTDIVVINSGTISAPNGAAIANFINAGGTSRPNAHLTISDAVIDSGALLALTNPNEPVTGTLNVQLDNVDTSRAGGILLDDTAAVTVDLTVSEGTGLTGDVTNSGSSALTVNLDHSALTGDIANQGDGTIVIILDHDSVGTGGYHGGDLITGSDSAWTFTKNSHGNYGQNDGVWNIGDYEVIFDNMTNTGTVTISVNSDTGAGGSITITDTADGEGTVHIDTTGNGKLNPNDVLPGVVTGDGTEHWQWDPIDWGLDTIIKDGDHFIKQGTSPAGAVLNSSVAIQQAMWFAQQNSLLKRMGELRYGARASRPPAGETPALHIIENLWIRSYGQQLNIGSQVSGKAYEQLIYGVDLGTDHKFTISADSDLYLGVYAGYGRSDLDYRTLGADGEINSYYGGLYATWLHSSGFYLDATIKAASVDNDLKAPYGNTQLKANYSDVNLGGSIEIGKKFTFKDDWFIEPQFQVNYLHILAEDYQAGPMTINAQDLDALQLRIGSLFGRTINLTNSGALQPYVKISGVETISTGGTIRNGYQHTRANTDGARAELGGGIIWQLNANNQLHLDYEASFGDKYDKPWGLSAGYRHQF